MIWIRGNRIEKQLQKSQTEKLELLIDTGRELERLRRDGYSRMQKIDIVSIKKATIYSDVHSTYLDVSVRIYNHNDEEVSWSNGKITFSLFDPNEPEISEIIDIGVDNTLQDIFLHADTDNEIMFHINLGSEKRQINKILKHLTNLFGEPTNHAFLFKGDLQLGVRSDGGWVFSPVNFQLGFIPSMQESLLLESDPDWKADFVQLTDRSKSIVPIDAKNIFEYIIWNGIIRVTAYKKNNSSYLDTIVTIRNDYEFPFMLRNVHFSLYLCIDEINRKEIGVYNVEEQILQHSEMEEIRFHLNMGENQQKISETLSYRLNVYGDFFSQGEYYLIEGIGEIGMQGQEDWEFTSWKMRWKLMPKIQDRLPLSKP